MDTLHKSGVCISYSDALLLYDHWALKDVEVSATCPPEIADSKPGIVIVDNDDFKLDTMTGSAAGAHRTNVMYVQPDSYERKPDEVPVARLAKKQISEQLTQKCGDMTHVHQYRCPLGSTSEPPIRARVNPPMNGTAPQCARSVIHALSRTNNDGTRPLPHEQRAPAYSGAQSCRCPPPNKSKAYFHTTYDEPPSKSVVHNIITKLVETMRKKNIHSSFSLEIRPPTRQLSNSRQII